MSRRQESIGMSQEPRLEQDISYLFDTTSTPIVRRYKGKVVDTNEAAKQMFEGLDAEDVRLRRVVVEQEQVYDRRRGVWLAISQIPVERADGGFEILEAYHPIVEEKPVKAEKPYNPGYRLKRSGREIIWKSAQTYDVLQNAIQYAPSDSPVLIFGETGVGKDMIAELIHYNSGRIGQYVVVNCSELDETMLKSELFGHMRGSFTGAVQDKKGLLEVADRGTVFLDESGDMDKGVQAMLLRALEYKSFRKMGGVNEISSDFRLVTATNKNLEEETEAGRFRKDLFYRLNVLAVNVLPLRERAEDIPALIDYLVYEKTKGRGKRFSEEAMDFLIAYRWPGNIRELSHVVEIAMIVSRESTMITERHLPPEMIRRVKMQAAGMPDVKPKPLREVVSEFEMHRIAKALDTCGWNNTRAAEILGVSRTTLIAKIRKHGISQPLEKNFLKKE
jgi:transcriptional regulator with PAS, ATPase and Fis domain